MKTNNLFRYATSELSQDAFICWLMNFAHKDHFNEDTILTECAKAFLAKILKIKDEDIIVTKIDKQYLNIDVLIEVNGTFNIIIEDKTFTNLHGNQINRYRDALEKEGRNNIVCVYYKIIEQSSEENCEINITRTDLIKMFSQYAYKTNNNIFNDYYEYLLFIDNEVKRYMFEPIQNWTKGNDHPYKGFFTHLIADNIIEVNRGHGWNYVANPRGGIRALWWFFLNTDELIACNLEQYVDDLYLQVEDNLIVVKMTANLEFKSDVRWGLYNYMKSKIPEFNKKVFKSGKWMTIGYIEYNERNYQQKINMMQDLMYSLGKGEYKFSSIGETV